MAYVSQDMKKAKLEKIKPILKKYGLKGSMSVRHHSTLVLNISEGKIDFIKNSNDTCSADFYQIAQGYKPCTDQYMQVNEFHYEKHFSGVALKALKELYAVLFEGHWDNSDIMTDYFNTAYYVNLNIGNWDKPYKFSP